MRILLTHAVIILSVCVYGGTNIPPQNNEPKRARIFSTDIKISKIQTLPHDQEYSFNGHLLEFSHADIGVMYEQFSIFSVVPILNFGEPKFVFYRENLCKDNEKEWNQRFKWDDNGHLQKIANKPNEGKLNGIEKGDYLYTEISNDEVNELRNKFPNIPPKPTIPFSFWDSIGGKCVCILLIMGIIFGKHKKVAS